MGLDDQGGTIVSQEVQEWASRVLQGVKGWVDAGAVSCVVEECGPAEFEEEVPKVNGQLTKITRDGHLLVRVSEIVGVGWPRVYLLWWTLAPLSRDGLFVCHWWGACACNDSGDKVVEDGALGW